LWFLIKNQEVEGSIPSALTNSFISNYIYEADD